MNYSHNGSNEALETRNRSRDVSLSGVCTRCMAYCQGNCDVFRSSFRGREVIYPGPFGRDDRRLRQAVPRRLLPPEYPGLRLGR